MRLMTDFSLGDVVWKASRRQEKYWKPCAFCDSTGQISSVDGNTIRVCPECYGQRGKHDWKPAAWRVDGPYTVGRIEVKITGGVPDEERYSREERYMCIETGVGSGTLHAAEDLFEFEDEAVEACEQRNMKEGLVVA